MLDAGLLILRFLQLSLQLIPKSSGPHHFGVVKQLLPAQFMRPDAQEVFAPKVCTVRNEPVVLDSDLALLYDVELRVFNQAIRRNRHRFPFDFAFQLTREEWHSLRSQIVILKGARGQHRKYLPWVFTEHGAIMAAMIASTP